MTLTYWKIISIQSVLSLLNNKTFKTFKILSKPCNDFILYSVSKDPHENLKSFGFLIKEESFMSF